MPWTNTDYPVSMKNLPVRVRNKAVEIANALLAEKHMKDEGILIATAISRAKDWAANRGQPAETGASRSEDVKVHGKDQYVVPEKEGWGVKEEAAEHKAHFRLKKDAVAAAKEKARKYRSAVTIQKKDGRVQTRVSYNPNNKGRRS